MKAGVIASGLLHAAVLGLLLFGLPFFDHEPPKMNVIPVEIIPEAELADVTTAKPEPKKEEKEPPKEEKAAPPPPPKTAPAPPPPAASADDVPPLEDITPRRKPKPKQPPAPRITEKITPRVKPNPPSRFDTSRIAALLDKSKKPEPQPETAKPLDLKKLAKDLGKTSIDSQRQLATLSALMRSQIEKCWDLPAGAKNAQNLIVRLRILLNPDGSLIGDPDLVNKERLDDPDGRQFEVAVRAAKNAVYACTPLKLPRDQYELWRESIQTFDPREMLGVK